MDLSHSRQANSRISEICNCGSFYQIVLIRRIQFATGAGAVSDADATARSRSSDCPPFSLRRSLPRRRRRPPPAARRPAPGRQCSRIGGLTGRSPRLQPPSDRPPTPAPPPWAAGDNSAGFARPSWTGGGGLQPRGRTGTLLTVCVRAVDTPPPAGPPVRRASKTGHDLRENVERGLFPAARRRTIRPRAHASWLNFLNHGVMGTSWAEDHEGPPPPACIDADLQRG